MLEMNELQEYVRQGPRLPPLTARHKALPDLCPAAETNSAHTAAAAVAEAAAATAAGGNKEEVLGLSMTSLVVRNGAPAASSNSSNSSSSSGALSPTATPGSAPTFPTVPTLVGGKYLLSRPLDHSTCHATHLHTRQNLLVKVLSGAAGHELVAQHALVAGCEGVRAPLELVVSPCRRRTWVVFPAHQGDLHSYVRARRRLREVEAQRLFAKVAATVATCHCAGLVLRDLKLRKFVFTDSAREHVCLESLEDSVLVGEEDYLQDKHGCPAYVAPEILTSSSYSGRAADMWGLGVMLYTMLVGRYPFHDSDTSSLFAKIRSGEFKVPEWVSSRARHLINALLRRDPERRLSIQDVVSHPWLTRPPRDHPPRDPSDHTVPSILLPPSGFVGGHPLKATSTISTHLPSLFGL